MMQLLISRDAPALVPLLRDADEDVARTKMAIADTANTPYIAAADSNLIGAAIMRWQPDESELLYIAVAQTRRGQGWGKKIIDQLVQEAHQRATSALLVGTANSSLQNIAFYQKCGFRMHEVRKDYFAYLPHPVYEHGIRIQDMLVLRRAL